MSDDVDIAAEHEQEARDRALAEQRRRAAIGRCMARSATVCQNEYCGTVIPEARRQAVPGCQLCVECQQRQEKRP